MTARRVATSAGLKHQLVHCCFHTMDDPFLRLFRRLAQQGLEQQPVALSPGQPLCALREFSTGRPGPH